MGGAVGVGITTAAETIMGMTSTSNTIMIPEVVKAMIIVTVDTEARGPANDAGLL